MGPVPGRPLCAGPSQLTLRRAASVAEPRPEDAFRLGPAWAEWTRHEALTVPALSAGSPEIAEFPKLLHELPVHQVELAMRTTVGTESSGSCRNPWSAIRALRFRPGGILHSSSGRRSYKETWPLRIVLQSPRRLSPSVSIEPLVAADMSPRLRGCSIGCARTAQ